MWSLKTSAIARTPASGNAKRIEKAHSWKVLFIVRHHSAAIGLGDGGIHHIECASWPAHGCAFRHEASPYEGRRSSNGNTRPGKNRELRNCSLTIAVGAAIAAGPDCY